jgi:hypothetical protein
LTPKTPEFDRRTAYERSPSCGWRETYVAFDVSTDVETRPESPRDDADGGVLAARPRAVGECPAPGRRAPREDFLEAFEVNS